MIRVNRGAWELTDVMLLPDPSPAKGARGVWEWGERQELP